MANDNILELEMEVDDFMLTHFYEVQLKFIYPTTDEKDMKIGQEMELLEIMDLGDNAVGLVFENR
jgi:hypothetical protein